MKRLAINGLLTLCLVGGMSAQTVNERKENQQDRIAQGVKSGQMTAGETAKVEGQEAKVNRQVRKDRKANDGSLTAGERAKVNREQNHMSREIYRDKHNNAKQ